MDQNRELNYVRRYLVSGPHCYIENQTVLEVETAIPKYLTVPTPKNISLTIRPYSIKKEI